MSICSAGARTARNFVTRIEIPVAELPAFLCPGLLRTAYTRPRTPRTHCRYISKPAQRRCVSTETTSVVKANRDVPIEIVKKLPRQCPGCGAHTQFVDKEEAGYYTTTRTSLQTFLGINPVQDASAEDTIISAALKNAGEAASSIAFKKQKPKPLEHPFCDRCHDIIHHNSGVSIHHPTPAAIQDTILESPHKYNHIYHIIDAADFPMSVIPQLQKLLHASPQRSHNRRAKSDKFYHGKQIEMSFIITRSDLLAAKKEQVDAMMPYLRETLRDTLGRSAKDARLGNVKCVSAQRQWWTSGLKDEIFKQGGGSWMVGKVNVGKSRLLHEIFPKGRREAASSAEGYKSVALEVKADSVSREGELGLREAQNEGTLNEDTSLASLGEESSKDEPTLIDTSSLLPPLPAEVDYPTMPIVSALPGTTASPIRLSFGRGKGEMIDLPGLSRGDIEKHIETAHRDTLVMKKRIEPKQQNIQPGQSLLLGGFIRITPTSPLTYLAYNFTPLEEHKTSTVKATEVQERGAEARNVQNIALPETAAQTKLAGKFYLKWDVTKQRAGPLTNSAMVGLKPENLPFKVMGTDLLIEGVGWVEIVAQVRKRRGDSKVKLAEHDNEASVDVGVVERAEVSDKSSALENTVTTYSPLATDHDAKTSSSPSAPDADGKVHYSPLGSQSSSSSPSNTPSTSTSTSLPERPSTPAPNEIASEAKEEEIDSDWPSFEVYTPEGKFVATRRPMNAWMNVLAKPKKPSVRPRKSMKGKKKEAKKARRGW